jgi:hypothetical protein
VRASTVSIHDAWRSSAGEVLGESIANPWGVLGDPLGSPWNAIGQSLQEVSGWPWVMLEESVLGSFLTSPWGDLGTNPGCVLGECWVSPWRVLGDWVVLGECRRDQFGAILLLLLGRNQSHGPSRSKLFSLVALRTGHSTVNRLQSAINRPFRLEFEQARKN